jgi:hypothetical protein
MCILASDDVGGGASPTMAEDDLYHRDFFRWTRDQAARLRTLSQRQTADGRDPENAEDGVLDAGHLADEVAQAGRSGSGGSTARRSPAWSKDPCG